MWQIALASVWNNHFWYALPLIVAISLVYSATRHEEMGPILRRALSFAGWIVGFMLVIFVILVVVSRQL